MAVTSGSVTTNTNSSGYFYVNWSRSDYSVDGNYSIIYWEAVVYCGYDYYSNAIRMGHVTINGEQVYSGGTYSNLKKGSHILASGTLSIKHNDDGNKTFTISNISGWLYSNHNYSAEAQSFELPQIPRASTPSVGGTLQIGSTITIYTNRASNSFSHNIYVSWGSQITNQRILTGVGDNSSWTIPKDFANYIPYGVSGTLYLTCETYSGSTKIGDKTINFNVGLPDTSEFKPSISDVNIWENSGSDVPSSWGIYVQNASKISYEVSANGAYSSTISSYNVSINGMTYYSKAYTTNYIKTSGTNTVEVTVTDSRGRSATFSKTFEVVAYSGPKINTFTVNRCDEDGTYNDEGSYAKIEIEVAIPKLNNKNTYAYYLKKKLSEDTTYTDVDIELIDYSDLIPGYDDDSENKILNGEIIIEASEDESYDFIFSVTDKFNTIPSTIDLDTAFQLVDFNASGKGIAIGKVSKKDALEIDMDIYDKFDQLIQNGLAEYKTGGTDIDPNTTLSHLILTETNVPNNSFYYVMTLFYDTKSTTTNRTQIAVPYIYDISQNKKHVFIRQYVNGTWNNWTKANGEPYPIGSIYMSVNDTNPSVLFGGTWEQIKGRFLLGCGENDDNTTNYWGSYPAGTCNFTAGEKSGEPYHHLTVDELPPHYHTGQYWNGNRISLNYDTNEVGYSHKWASGSMDDTNCYSTGTVGSGHWHNNLPPYLTVYMWKRIA